MPRYEPWNTERASTIIAAHKDQDGAALTKAIQAPSPIA